MNEDSEDLLNVRDTAALLGVHENTVRNWAKVGVLRDSRIPGSRFHRFSRSDVERLVTQRGKARPTLQEERQTIGPELVDASQLAAWANVASRQAQDAFPELMRRLLAATPGVTSIVVRAGDGVQSSGWDGMAASQGGPYLPAGDLRFEFGVTRAPKSKADEDWAGRTADGEKPNECFVFATPRRWRDGQTWATAHRDLGLFADVKVMDADDLEGWLTATPSVHHWISELLGRRPRDAVTMEEWWRRFVSAVSIDLPSDAFVAGRGEQSDRLKQLMGEEARVTTVKSESSDDALAFVHAATRTEGNHAPPPILVVSSAEAWDRIVCQPGRVVLVPSFERPSVGEAIRHGHHVLIVVDRSEDSGRAVDIELPRIGRAGAADAFQSAGVDFALAQRYAAQARRNFPAFIRDLSIDPRRASPYWSRLPTSRPLALLTLVGSWTTEAEDLEVVTRITGESWSTLEDTVKGISSTSDPVFRQIGPQWSVTSPAGSFLLLKSALRVQDVERWSSEVRAVLLAPDPALDPTAEDHPFASILTVKGPYSSTLRDGLAQGLALMGSLGDRDTPDGTTSLADSAAETVRIMLEVANDDATGRAWQALSSCLPMLAEAAPEVFLDAIDRDLRQPNPILRSLFRDGTEGPMLFGPSSPHPHLLWALEALAWSKEYFLDAVRLLARLAAIDPGGNTQNRPAESLKNILSGWVRHTSASSEDRVRALDVVIATDAEVGWDLLMKLWPSTHTVTMPPATPRVRDWKPNSSQVQLSEWANFVHELVSRALVLAAHNGHRLADLAEGLASIPAVDQDAIIVRLQDAATVGLSGSDRLTLWESIRNLIARHERFSAAEGAMPDATLKRLGVVLADLECEDDPHRFDYLFDWHPDLPGVDSTDYRTYQARQRTLQSEAVSTILAQERPIETLGDVALRVPVPTQLGVVLAEHAEVALADIAPWMVAEAAPLRDVAASWIRAKLTLDGPPWLADTLGQLRDDAQAREFVLRHVNPQGDNWRVIAKSKSDLDFYWCNANIDRVATADLEVAVDELMRRKRALAGVAVLGNALLADTAQDDDLRSVDPDLVARVLNAVILEDTDKRDVSTMTGYYIGRLLDYLSSVGTDLAILARFEFAFFWLLEHDREPRALERALADDPELFVDLVKQVYRGKSEPTTAPSQEVAAHAWWVLQGWKGFPGKGEDGTLNPEAMNSWVTGARLALSEVDRADIGDELIGQAFAHSPVGPDGVWPDVPVRELIERLGSREMENGLAIGRFNSRGVVSRGVYDGGALERELESQYRTWCNSTKGTWPRTSRVLRDLADSYRRDAWREDIKAELDADHL